MHQAGLAHHGVRYQAGRSEDVAEGGFLPGGEGGRAAASLVFSHQVKLVALWYALCSFVSVRVNAHLGVAATTPLANALFVFLCLQTVLLLG